MTRRLTSLERELLYALTDVVGKHELDISEILALIAKAEFIGGHYMSQAEEYGAPWFGSESHPSA